MEFALNEMETTSISTLNSLSQQFCPECGADMVEADRLSEDDSVYIWYMCSRSRCNGSWLEKVKKSRHSA